MAGVTAILVILLAIVPVYAVDYTVGDTQGWETNVDYSTWASGKTFNVGDNLVFTYTPLHSVDEVQKSDYDSCSTSNTIQSYNNQNTKIALTAPGSRYFICGTAGHCSGGMKLAVTVSGSSPGTPSTPSTPSTPGGSTPTPTTPSTPSGPSGSSPPTKPSSKNAAAAGGFHGGNAMLLGALLGGLALLV